ncbi:MAG TPA: cation diffusion facilitator family transporter [Pseudonocardiaceae bacterium]|nr:cation diffusion facilitator family transporter [Pseudonocardiaceae bacterium]
MVDEHGHGLGQSHGPGHDRGHGHGHGHGYTGGRNWRHFLAPHSHDAADQLDERLTSSRVGMRALWGSFAVLVATAAVQAGVVTLTGSVALLSDTLHNVADAGTAIPLAVAFRLGRRSASRRFTYGYGRAEDLAGLVVLLVIAGSAVLAVVESLRRLAHPQDVRQLPVLAGAAVIGFLGNEIAARWRTRAGRRIGSAALVADGAHARTDGFTSLSVLVAAGGAAVGWRWVDPVVGVLVAVLVGLVLVSTARSVLGRLLDAAEPATVDRARALAAGTPGVLGVEEMRLRWSGHGQLAEMTVTVDRAASLVRAHEIAHEAEHRLLHGIPRLMRAHVHPHPAPAADRDDHAGVAHHTRTAEAV